MKNLFFKILRFSGLPLLFRELWQRRKVSILMFHDISRTTAESVFSYLAKNYNIIPLSQFIKAKQQQNRKAIPSKALIVTFDDGHKRNYELLPVLDKYQVPTTIFLCSGIVDTNRHYWFTHRHPEYSTDELKEKTNQERLQLLKEIDYYPEKEYQERQALTKMEIEEMRPIIDFQAHTIFHPCLPQCETEKATEEITLSKEMLEEKYGFSINALAFPNGDYCERDIEIVKNAGFQCSLTTEQGYNSLDSNPFKLKRISTNDVENMDEFIVRVSGVWSFIKRFSIPTLK